MTKAPHFDPRPHSLFIKSDAAAGKLFSPSGRYYDCGCCGAFHADEFTGDCRDDNARLDLDELEARHGSEWQEVDMV